MDSTETMELVENMESMENVEFVDKSAGVMQVCRGMVRVSCREVGSGRLKVAAGSGQECTILNRVSMTQ